MNWILAIVLVYAALFGIGHVVLGRLPSGFLLLALAGLAFVLIMRNLDFSENRAPG